MSYPSNSSLLARAWRSLAQKGPLGLGRDVRDYTRWRLGSGTSHVADRPPLPLSNWDLNGQELRTLPETLRSKPILVYAEASTRCNLHCFMCRLSFPETTRRVRQNMSLETFAKLEPLLEPGSRLTPLRPGRAADEPRLCGDAAHCEGAGRLRRPQLQRDAADRAHCQSDGGATAGSPDDLLQRRHQGDLRAGDHRRELRASPRQPAPLQRDQAISDQRSAVSRQRSAVSRQQSVLSTGY